MAWPRVGTAMTKRQIEATARAVVDNLLGRGFASSLDDGAALAAAADGAPASAELPAISAAEFEARGEVATPPQSHPYSRPATPPALAATSYPLAQALVIIGGIFAGERQGLSEAIISGEAVGKAVQVAGDGLSRLAGHANLAASSARSLFGGLQQRLAAGAEPGGLQQRLASAAAAEQQLAAPALSSGGAEQADGPSEVAGAEPEGAGASPPAPEPPANLSAFFREIVMGP